MDVQTRDFFEVVGNRRSVRYFKPWKPVEPEKIQTILQAARLASHMGNANGVQAVVVTDPDTQEKLKDVVSPFNVPIVDMAPVSIIWHFNRNAWYNEIQDHLAKLLEIGAVNPSHGWSMDNIQNSTGPRLTSFPEGVVNFLLACETGMAMAQAHLTAVALGLGCTAFAGRGEKIQELLDIPENCGFMWGMAIGYPAEELTTGGQRPKKDFGTIFFENKYGNPLNSDPSVEEELREMKLLQPTATLTPERKAEINSISKMMGLPERE